MALVTLRYKVASAGFQPGDVVTVEDTPYVRARFGSTFDLISTEAQEAAQEPEAPQEPQEPAEPAQEPQEPQEAPDDDNDGPLPE